MKKNVLLCLTALTIFLAIDALWLGVIAKDFFHSHLGPVLPLTLSVVPALVFYLLFAVAIVFFAAGPAIQANSMKSAFLRGAFFGLVTYGAYDLTNHATVLNWPAIVTIVDMSWGSFLTALVSGTTCWVGRRLAK